MPSRISRVVLFIVLASLSAFNGSCQSLHKTNVIEANLYDADPGHVANRLYRALYSWKGDQEATPSHWPRQKVTYDSASLKSLLDELLQLNVAKEFPDPVKRVFLQRDLWMAFDWLAQQPAVAGGENPVIQRKLARGIEHLALPLAQLRQLPDNYEEQLGSDAYPIEFDHGAPNTPYLPAGLFARTGSWIMVGDRDTRGVLTMQHLDFFRGHNAYMVFVRLPAGRAATIGYLNKLTTAAMSHSKLPLLPEGSQMALLSQVMAVDDKGMPFPTTITENVQIRVYRKPKDSLTKAEDAQSLFEFRLDRAALFAHKAVTLRPVGAKDTDWESINYLGQKKGDSDNKAMIMSSCFDCHNEPGAESFKTFSEMRAAGSQIRQMTLSSRSQEVGRTVTWKKHQLDFQLLREFWAQ
jgi:hypothetical protein